MVHVIDRLSTELADNTELFEMSKGEGDEAGMVSVSYTHLTLPTKRIV